MAEANLILGDRQHLAFELTWVDAVPSGTAAEATLARMCVYVAGQLVWGDAAASGSIGFEWPWIEALEHLAGAWKYLEWEEMDPLGLGGDPDKVRARAEPRWAEMPELDVSHEDEQLCGFERTHNLGAGLRGAWPPPLWILRTGALARIASHGARTTWTWSETARTLERLAQALVARLEPLKDERAELAVRAWKKRAVRGKELVTIATGLPADVIDNIVGSRDLREVFELDARRPTELLVAARMLGSGTTAALAKAVLGRIGSIRSVPAPGLDALSAAAQLVELEGVPHRQGRDLAHWLRERIGLGAEQACDVEPYLAKLGVLIEDLSVASKTIDAVCAWGPKHGPVILVNSRGPHAAGARGRRATLAHELCHLLVDRGGVLPLAEVKGGQVPRDVEARANAFAAELLVPATEAAVALASAGRTIEQELDRVCRRYGASRAIVAWQALNSGVILPERVKRYLLTVAPKLGMAWAQ